MQQSLLPDACLSLPVSAWRPTVDVSAQAQAVAALEEGKIVYLPNLPFAMTPQERSFMRDNAVKPGVKSIKYSLSRQTLWGAAETEQESPVLAGMLKRYAEAAQRLVAALLPHYAGTMTTGNTSFRPVEVEGRVQSKRQDDRRLHVDAFPSQPMQGRRILRVFTNVNPNRPRLWHVGEPFAEVAKRFLPKIASPLPGSAWFLEKLKLTKGYRTPYDHYMLRLHDGMKLDDRYQANTLHTELKLAPGATWLVYTDQVSHASLAGQHALEQTFTLPVIAMANPDSSPLRMLEKMKGQRLA